MKPVILDSQSTINVNIDNELSFFDKQNFGSVYEDEPLEDGSIKKVFFDGGQSRSFYSVYSSRKLPR